MCAQECRRGCGFRKVGGTYLCSDGPVVHCDRLPISLTICPTCGNGVKQARSWTWVTVAPLVGGIHQNCGDSFSCPVCMATEEMGKAGLLWVGEKFYRGPDDFLQEATTMGVSRRIKAVPHGFELGKTWVLLAHPKACYFIATPDSEAFLAGQGDLVDTKYSPGIFYVFKPARIERIITDKQAEDKDFMDSLKKQKLTPVIVSADDKDHQGTVYDKENGDDE